MIQLTAFMSHRETENQDGNRLSQEKGGLVGLWNGDRDCAGLAVGKSKKALAVSRVGWLKGRDLPQAGKALELISWIRTSQGDWPGCGDQPPKPRRSSGSRKTCWLC